MKWHRFAMWGTLVVILIAGLVFAFWPRPVAVDFATVGQGELLVTIDEEAETRVRDVFVLSAPVGGRLLRIESEVGDRVTAGRTVIARIEPADPAFLDIRSESEVRAAVRAAESALALAKAELQEAIAERDFAQSELNRAEQLFRSRTIAQRALDDAQRLFKTRSAAVTTARAAVDMRQFQLAEVQARLMSPNQTVTGEGACECVTIIAPVTGQILRLMRESEAVVSAGEALVEIGDPASLEIVADLLSSDAVKVEPGQPVIIDDWGGPYTLDGAVRRVEPFGFTKVSALGIEEQRVNVIIDINDPHERWQRLGHGYRVEVRVVLWHGEDVVKVPLTALFRDGSAWSVFLDENGRASRRTVQLGHSNGLEAEVVGGLAVGERIVVHPSDRVVDGVRLSDRR